MLDQHHFAAALQNTTVSRSNCVRPSGVRTSCTAKSRKTASRSVFGIGKASARPTSKGSVAGYMGRARAIDGSVIFDESINVHNDGFSARK
jgi:hypothetical protein